MSTFLQTSVLGRPAPAPSQPPGFPPQGTVGGVIYRSIADAIVTNTTTESSIIGAGVGSLLIPAEYPIQGTTVRCRIGGTFSNTTGAAGFITFSVKINATVILVSQAFNPGASGTTNKGFAMFCDLTFRTIGVAGTLMGSGIIMMDSASGEMVNQLTTPLVALQNPAVVVNTTVPMLIDVTAQWGGVSILDILTGQTAVVELIK